MSEQQPEALRLADRLDLYATGDKHQKDIEQATAEMRRLHSVNADLLEALKHVRKDEWLMPRVTSETRRIIRAAIAKATGAA